jgi:hypothetical protein
MWLKIRVIACERLPRNQNLNIFGKKSNLILIFNTIHLKKRARENQKENKENAYSPAIFRAGASLTPSLKVMLVLLVNPSEMDKKMYNEPRQQG